MHQNHRPVSYAEQFEKTSGLTEWLAWLLILTSIFGVLAIAMYLHSDAAVEYGMYVIILGMGGVLIAKGYFDASFIHREMKLASLQVKLLEKVDDFDQFLQHAPSSVFRSHIDNLYTISMQNADVSQDNLIELLHARLLAKNRVVELFASILITLGLVGTIIGLISMMDSLVVTVEEVGGSSENILPLLFNKDDGPLGGLGVAFLTTLLGAVLGGVILRILTSVIDANITKYTSHLAELTEVYVLPQMRKMAKEREQKEIREQ